VSGEQQETRKRSAAEIEADLKRSREELTRTVDELSGRLDPRRQAQAAAEQGRQFVENVRSGDPAAVRIAGGVAAVVAAVVGVGILRRHR
jgi:hypothetical protein